VTKSSFRGKWRIVHMDEWGRDYLDLVKPAAIEFSDDDQGDFLFGTVRGWMDCRYGTRDGHPFVEFSWEGMNDTDPSCGRGWAILTPDGTLTGHLFIHCSDNSPFKAQKM